MAVPTLVSARRRGGRVAEGGGLLNRYTGQNLYRGFESLPLRQSSARPLATLGISPAGSRFALARKAAQVRIPPSPPAFCKVPRYARDFACGLPLRSRPQSGSSSNPSLSASLPPGPSLRSGFRLRAPASLTPAKRLKFESLPLRQSSARPLATLGISPAARTPRKAAQVRIPPSPPVFPKYGSIRSED